MKKHNKSQIMRKAHEIYRTDMFSPSWSQALREAWQEAKFDRWLASPITDAEEHRYTAIQFGGRWSNEDREFMYQFDAKRAYHRAA